MATLHIVCLAGRLELLGRELADRLQHPEARPNFAVASSQEALVQQRLQQVRLCADNLLSRLEAATAGEHAHSPKQRLLAAVEQVVAPGNRRPQCLLRSEEHTSELQSP